MTFVIFYFDVMNGVTSDCQSRAKEPVGEKSR